MIWRQVGDAVADRYWRKGAQCLDVTADGVGATQHVIGRVRLHETDGLGTGQAASAFQDDLDGRLQAIGCQDGLADLKNEPGGRRLRHCDTLNGSRSSATHPQRLTCRPLWVQTGATRLTVAHLEKCPL